ncbi:hypothetical protein BGZ54_005123 [Gamsiella multidivaricata]|nr:hypothetical protein BGZ54_005123 [Gamsiella multidivaricata]
MILHLCGLSNPFELWQAFAKDLSEDSLYHAADRPNAEEDARSTALFHVNEVLKGAGTSLAVYEEMPRDFRNLIDRQLNNDKLGQHAKLDTGALAAKVVHDLDLCNDDQ